MRSHARDSFFAAADITTPFENMKKTVLKSKTVIWVSGLGPPLAEKN
jgi:hypothetical protein